jgi:hypothetical protein
VIKSALALFNDRITRAAFSRGLPLIDLRLICNEEGDYANPIEPSVQGGAKIAACDHDARHGPKRSGLIPGDCRVGTAMIQGRCRSA